MHIFSMRSLYTASLNLEIYVPAKQRAALVAGQAPPSNAQNDHSEVHGRAFGMHACNRRRPDIVWHIHASNPYRALEQTAHADPIRQAADQSTSIQTAVLCATLVTQAQAMHRVIRGIKTIVQVTPQERRAAGGWSSPGRRTRRALCIVWLHPAAAPSQRMATGTHRHPAAQ